MNRRRFLIGLSAVCSACTSLAAAQLRVAAEGCGLTSGFGSLSDHTSQSGDAQLDRALIAEVRKLDREFRISPGYRFLRDGDQPNAYATRDTVVEGTQGTIFFGLSLLQNELRTDYGGAAIAGIAAHEGAHIVQFESPELSKRLSSSTSKLRELHADFLAGYYFARTGRTERSLITFGESLFAKGDYKYNDKLHHGTPQQRVEAMRAGYGAGRHNLDEAANRGVTYVIGA